MSKCGYYSSPSKYQ